MPRLLSAFAPCALVAALAAPGVMASLPEHPAEALRDAIAIAWGHASNEAAEAITGEVAHAAAQSERADVRGEPQTRAQTGRGRERSVDGNSSAFS
jgi:hypothetical protein